MIRCVLTQYGRLNEHESRRGAGLAHDVIKTSDRGDLSCSDHRNADRADQLVDDYEQQEAVLGEYTSNHCVLREAWEARLTRQ